MTARPGKAAIFEQLAADGITYMFGNPGTVEQGLLDAGSDSGTEYVLTLHEGVAVAMADGYARASGRPALVQLHTGVGLGNGIGLLYQALRGGSPLVVVAGDAGVRYDAMDSQMATDLVAMASPVTKYATRVTHPSSVLRMLRRAVKMAMTPPRGPVFLGLPADVLDELTEEPATPTSIPSTRVAPERSLVTEAASLLLDGERRLILIGDGVADSGAQEELRRVAEQLNAPVWGVTSSEMNFDATHYLAGGHLGHMVGSDSERVVRDADSVLVVGTYLFPEVFPNLSSPFASGARVVHVDLNSYEVAKNFPVDLGIAADPRLTLAALSREIDRQRPAGWPGPSTWPAGATPTPARPAGVSDEAEPPEPPDTVLERFVAELARIAPEDLVVFDEALTAAGPIARYLPATTPGSVHRTRGGSLGVGIPGAMGIRLARPDAPVVGFTGDGASMYTVQALWTAARHDIAAKFVICNNQRYRLLDLNLEQYRAHHDIPAHPAPDAFDLSTPEIDFVELAGSLDVPGRRVRRSADVPDAVRAIVDTAGPFLIDLRID